MECCLKPTSASRLSVIEEELRRFILAAPSIESITAEAHITDFGDNKLLAQHVDYVFIEETSSSAHLYAATYTVAYSND